MVTKKNGNQKKQPKKGLKKLAISSSGGPRATFAGSSVIDAPLALDMSRPVISQAFRTPIHKGSEGRVTGVDFIGSVQSSNSAYSITNYILNARNATTFPRLSAIAGVWRRYFPRMLKFHLYGINAATQRGYVAMSSLVTDDLATVITPTTEAQILNQENIAVGRPWSYTCHRVNLGGLGLKWYTTDTAAGAQEFGEAVGNAFLGIPQTTNAGDIEVQIYVEYDMEFCQRILGNLVTNQALSTDGGLISGPTPVSGNMFEGGVVDPQSSGFSLNAGTGIITFNQAGTWIMALDANGSGTPGGFTNLTGFTSLMSSTSTASNTNVLQRSITTVPTSIGPVGYSSGTVTDALLVLSKAPPNSLSIPEPKPYRSRFPRVAF